MERRPYLIAAGSAATALLAGCLSEFQSDDDDDEASEKNQNDGTESGPEAAVVAYLEAAADEDTDAIAEVTHSASFLDPEVHEESDFEYRFDSESDVDSVDDLETFETEVLVEDGTVEDVLDLEGTSFLFDEGELEAEIGDEEIALVETTVEHAESGSEAIEGGTTVWVVATEDDEWRVFWATQRNETPDDPEEAFQEEIIDEDDDVVAEIDWEYDQDTGDDVEWDVEWAEVVLAESPGIDADTVRIESTIEGSEFEFTGEGSNAWAGSSAYVALNAEGDQIVVTAVSDGDEEVVHREHYEP